jgi:hypothetical protein
MDDNLIAWNLENWITVVLMVALAFALLALTTQAVRKARAKSGAA